LSLIGCSLASSLLFFAVTNFGCWLLFGGYAQTVTGLVTCYAQALPFFRNTLIGDAFFAGTLFGGYALFVHVLGQPIIRSDKVVAASLA
jgi:hypothetical protein